MASIPNVRKFVATLIASQDELVPMRHPPNAIPPAHRSPSRCPPWPRSTAVCRAPSLLPKCCIAAVIESEFREFPTTQPERIAHHCAEAGQIIARTRAGLRIERHRLGREVERGRERARRQSWSETAQWSAQSLRTARAGDAVDQADSHCGLARHQQRYAAEHPDADRTVNASRPL